MAKTSERNSEIANTIINQMGGYGRLTAMIGLKNPHVATDDNYNELPGVAFMFKGSRKFNHCEVILEANDTYTVKLNKFSMRTYELKEIETLSDVYASELKKVFENRTGLYLSL